MNRQILSMALALGLGTTCIIAQQQPGTATADPGMSQGSAQNPATTDTAVPVDDQTLTTKLRQQLATDTAFKNVQIAVSSGKVDLTGTVPSDADRKRANDVAKAVPGVRDVRDKLTVNAAIGSPSGATVGSTATSETAHNTAGSIAGNSNTTSASTVGQLGEASGSTAAASQSAAQSSGTPASQSNPPGATGGIAGTSTATGAATDKTGSTSNTGAVGAPTAGAAGQSATTMSSDTATLRGQLESAYQSEPTLSTSHIVVNVTDSSIELTGSVPTPKERTTAKRIAQSYAGNRKVSEKLTVNGRSGSGTNNPGNAATSGNSSEGAGAGNQNPGASTTPNTKDPSMTPPTTDQRTTPPPSAPPTIPK